MTLFSAVESARFGWRIGRLDLEGSGTSGANGSGGAGAGAAAVAVAVAVAEAFESERLEILIVRTAAEDLVIPGVLASLPELRSLPAGTLLYWDWRDDGGTEVDATADSTDDPQVIEQLVRAVFDGYSNHYAANPLLSPERTVDGYCEWATALVATGKASCITSEHADAAGPIGLAAVDWTTDPPDIRLAGILPGRRGRGSYRRLIRLVMAESVRRGRGAAQISTQAHNTQVMRAWADLGWRPRRAIATTHIVPEALLRSSPPRAG